MKRTNFMMLATTFLSSCRNPPDTATAIMMTKEATAIVTIAALPWNFIFPDMNEAASKTMQCAALLQPGLRS